MQRGGSKAKQSVALLWHRGAELLKQEACRSRGVEGVPWHPQILVDQFTLSQPRVADYAHHNTNAPPPRILRPSYGPVGWASAYDYVHVPRDL